jgi:hypothetical protein
MKKTGMRVLGAAIAILLGTAWLHEREVKAGAQLGIGQPMCVSYVPRAWGPYRGGSQQSGPAFEDSAGTLRFVTSLPCQGTPEVSLEIRRTPVNTPSGN